jgi:hypothetical protein
MVLLEDPITAEPISRFQTEEDEAAARELIDQYKAVPAIDVSRLLCKVSHPDRCPCHSCSGSSAHLTGMSCAVPP